MTKDSTSGGKCCCAGLMPKEVKGATVSHSKDSCFIEYDGYATPSPTSSEEGKKKGGGFLRITEQNGVEYETEVSSEILDMWLNEEGPYCTDVPRLAIQECRHKDCPVHTPSSPKESTEKNASDMLDERYDRFAHDDGKAENCGCECHTTFTYKSHGKCCFILKPVVTPPTVENDWEEQLRLRVRFDRNQDREVCILFIERHRQMMYEKGRTETKNKIKEAIEKDIEGLGKRDDIGAQFMRKAWTDIISRIEKI